MAREMTSCWICSVPSKMSWISRFEYKTPAHRIFADHRTMVCGPQNHGFWTRNVVVLSDLAPISGPL